MRQPDDPEGIEERRKFWREYLSHPRFKPRKPIEPLVQVPPTLEELAEMQRIIDEMRNRGEKSE